MSLPVTEGVWLSECDSSADEDWEGETVNHNEIDLVLKLETVLVRVFDAR